MTALDKFRKRHGLAAIALLGVISAAGSSALSGERASEHVQQVENPWNGDPDWPLPDEPLQFDTLEGAEAEMVLDRLNETLRADIAKVEAAFTRLEDALFTMGAQTTPEERKARFSAIIDETLAALENSESKRQEWQYLTVDNIEDADRSYMVDYATRVSETRLMIANMQQDFASVADGLRSGDHQAAFAAFGDITAEWARYQAMEARSPSR